MLRCGETYDNLFCTNMKRTEQKQMKNTSTSMKRAVCYQSHRIVPKTERCHWGSNSHFKVYITCQHQASRPYSRIPSVVSDSIRKYFLRYYLTVNTILLNSDCCLQKINTKTQSPSLSGGFGNKTRQSRP